MNINLPTELLRSLITVADLGGYTKAGDALNRSQPAISLQMRRLEEMVGAKLIVSNGKGLKFTEAGEKLATYARQILHLNDDAVSEFQPKHVSGGVRIGLPTDFAMSYLQDTVLNFSNSHRDVDLEICCDLSCNLLTQLHSDEINLAIALIAEDKRQYLVQSWEEQPFWVMGKRAEFDLNGTVPLVGHPENCEYRNRMTEALEKHERKWRIAYTSPDISGVQHAVEAGFGVSALTHATLKDGMQILTAKQGFPSLKKISVGLFYKHSKLSLSGLKLSNHIISSLDEFAGK